MQKEVWSDALSILRYWKLRILANSSGLRLAKGRNALFLEQLGFDVTAVDVNPLSLDNLASIIEAEDLYVSRNL